jgi:tetratricopeptide (TPR) repeat protein
MAKCIRIKLFRLIIFDPIHNVASMQKIFLITVILTNSALAFSQSILTYNIDSLKQILSTPLQDTNRIWALNNLGRNIQNSDTTLLLASQAIELSQKIGFKKGEAEAYNNIAYWFNQKGNYPKALLHYLTSIKLSEEANYEAGLKRSFNSIATVYLYLKDYATSIGYARKARYLSIKLKDLSTQALAASWMSKSFLEIHRSDSALKYAQESYEVATRLKEVFPLYVATARLGEINAAEGNRPLAVEYLKMSLRYSKKDGRYFRIAGAHQQLATLYKNLGVMDSCLWHAQQAFGISKAENLSASLLSSSLLLSELYEGRNDTESLRYHKAALVAQDSLFSQEKNRQVEALSTNETLRQREIEIAKRQAEEERRTNLQYAGIAFGMVVFIIFFLLLSHTVIANETLIKFLGVLALLMVFEFINLLAHPFIANLTHHSPWIMLIIMVGIAAIVIPLHHRLEKLITHKLIEKNKKIRLVAAERILEKDRRKQV